MLRPRKAQSSSLRQAETAPVSGLREMEAASFFDLVRWTMELSWSG